MLAQALEFPPAGMPQKLPKRRRPQGRLSPHQRLVLKTEALFPGCELVQSIDFSEGKAQ